MKADLRDKFIEEISNNHIYGLAFQVDNNNEDFILIPTEYNGKFISREKAKFIIKGLKNYIDYFSDEEIKEANKLPKKNIEHTNKNKPNVVPYNKKGFVYFLKAEKTNWYKIGMTNNLHDRLNQLRPIMPFKIKIAYYIKANNRYKLEKKIHKVFKDKKINGEWFELSTNDIQLIKEFGGIAYE